MSTHDEGDDGALDLLLADDVNVSARGRHPQALDAGLVERRVARAQARSSASSMSRQTTSWPASASSARLDQPDVADADHAEPLWCHVPALR